MNHFILIVLTVGTCFLVGCNSAEESADKIQEETVQIIEEIQEIAEPNVDSLVSSINEKRQQIEANLADPIEVSTTNLREKIKQKWEKIHFYSTDNQVVRIKAYPYPSITNRTEEFYLENEQLILAVIEDNGEGEKGKAISELDKVYYFHNGEFLKEMGSSGEEEHAINNSEAEELQQEVAEYLEIFKTRP